jgi:rhodanese-related sulfurtransferase
MREVLARRAEEWGRVTASQLAGVLAADAAAAEIAVAAPSPRAAAPVDRPTGLMGRLAGGDGTPAGPSVTKSTGGPPTVVHDASATGVMTMSTAATVVVDVRDEDAYAALHIADAVHWPLLRVHQDKVPPALVAARHKADKLVVVVDDNERAATEVARKLLVSGAYPRIAVLTGGMQTVGEQLARANAVLTAPAPPPSRRSAAVAAAAASARMASSSASVGAGGGLSHSGAGGGGRMASSRMTTTTAGGRGGDPLALPLLPFLRGAGIPAAVAAFRDTSDPAMGSGGGGGGAGEPMSPERASVGGSTLRAEGGSPRPMPAGGAGSVRGSFGTSARFAAAGAGAWAGGR